MSVLSSSHGISLSASTSAGPSYPSTVCSHGDCRWNGISLRLHVCGAFLSVLSAVTGTVIVTRDLSLRLHVCGAFLSVLSLQSRGLSVERDISLRLHVCGAFLSVLSLQSRGLSVEGRGGGHRATLGVSLSLAP
ncbi:hypothetical protein ACOMHN_060571 [Nucella lapillus]